ncbi:MAG: hypothetical protein WCG25_04635 [bacterium]
MICQYTSSGLDPLQRVYHQPLIVRLLYHVIDAICKVCNVCWSSGRSLNHL